MWGSVYNRSEFLTSTQPGEEVNDPQLVARLFANEGPDFVKRLNGDFSIFLLRPMEKRAYLYRDQMGIRPMAYAIESEILHFSTDMVGLCMSLSADCNIDREYLLGYFKFINYTKTPERKVVKLLPGHYLEFFPGGHRINRYWEPEKINQDKALSHNQMLSDLKALLQDAISIRCDKRFNAGAHVSGGLDSGYVAALARREFAHQPDFKGFSWSPDEFDIPEGARHDERKLVTGTSTYAGIQPVFSSMSSNEFPGIVSAYDKNYGFFSEDFTLRQAVEFKINLILSGWGGDEFVSTGGCAIEADLLRSLNLRTFFRRNPLFPIRRFVRVMLACIINPALGFLGRDTRRSLRNDTCYIKRNFKKSNKKALDSFYLNTSRRQLHLGMLRFYHLPNRCEAWAVSGYRKGVEYRYPLMDIRIIEYMLKVPSKLLCVTDHYRPVLRLISEGILPEEVRWNRSKNDPVYWKYMNGLYEEASKIFMKEVGVWRANPYLDFVDFDSLEKDISTLNTNFAETERRILVRSLVYLKAINEFTVSYMKVIRDRGA
ncbi:MAG: asparagine synthase-related protein [Bacteroidales bacterium]|nr:asparagine synthase-related protein [Bacteroidales bacterium]